VDGEEKNRPGNKELTEDSENLILFFVLHPKNLIQKLFPYEKIHHNLPS
jgi:hypothetical protein